MLSWVRNLLNNSTHISKICQIHAQIVIHGLPLDSHLLETLIHLGNLDYASSVFKISSPTDYSWNVMIKGYTLNASPHNSVFMYNEMLRNDVRASNFTYPFLLKACSARFAIKEGEQVHAHVVKFGFQLDLYVNNTLIDMYSKCSCVEYAHRVLDEMRDRDEVSWNSIISGYVSCGEVENARKLFEEMTIRRNVFCWTTLINGYGKEGRLVRMFELFLQMLVSADEVGPNSATMVCLLTACSNLCELKLGRWFALFIHVNTIPLNAILNTALIDMYSKCGQVEKARRLFDGMSGKNLVSWNAMLTGYVQRGLLEDAIQLFCLMRYKLVKPNEITMVNVLSACAGLVEEGRLQFSNLPLKYGLSPKVEHYACMVDLLGRAGYLNEAIELVKNMVILPDSIIWGALLSACRIHGDIDLADKIGELLLSSPDPNFGVCILLSNIYASVGRWKDVARIRRLVKEKDTKKPSGCSWIEVDGVVHTFLVEDTTHMGSTQIYETHQFLINHLKLKECVLELRHKEP
ncbi:hypothetical protein IFM89_034527 [Coptis chinensis]|uniref:Pentatricopeptide repeat-containing protein n=1 Tax=Coptis chinensis TaxID=261450 RepID=A0A835HPM1_9MAGN|nr:hypothetical protein IFM89_034527 [Coptis chinensis]